MGRPLLASLVLARIRHQLPAADADALALQLPNCRPQEPGVVCECHRHENRASTSGYEYFLINSTLFMSYLELT